MELQNGEIGEDGKEKVQVILTWVPLPRDLDPLIISPLHLQDQRHRCGE